MVKINLLDWRQAEREQRQKNFLIGVGASAGVALLIVFGMMQTVDSWISRQQARNATLKQEIVAIDKKIEEIKELERLKADLLARMKIVEQLQQSRSQMVHFFDEIVHTLPQGVHLKSVAQTGTQTNISGVAESNGRVSTYIRNLDQSPWFTDPRLVVIKTDTNATQRQSSFELRVQLAGLPKSGEDNEEELQ